MASFQKNCHMGVIIVCPMLCLDLSTGQLAQSSTGQCVRCKLQMSVISYSIYGSSSSDLTRAGPAWALLKVSPSWDPHAVTSNSFVYTSGHCRRWRSRMEVKIMAGSLFVHCKIAYFYSVTAEKWLIVSLPNFVTIRRTHFSISCKIFSWIRSTKLKIHAMEFCDFIKDSVSPSGLFVPCSLTVASTWRPRLTAHCPIGERH